MPMLVIFDEINRLEFDMANGKLCLGDGFMALYNNIKQAFPDYRAVGDIKTETELKINSVYLEGFKKLTDVVIAESAKKAAVQA